MSLTITIGGVSRTSYLRINSLRITDEISARSTCDFELVDPVGSYRPVVGQEVIILSGATRVFAGSIDSLEEFRYPGTTDLEYQVTCVDYNQICDRRLVAKVYENQTAGSIVTDLCDTFLSGEGINSTLLVQAGITIEKAVFNYIPVTDALNQIADLTGYIWYIDYDKRMRFVARETFYYPALGQNQIRNVRVKYTRDQYRNKQLIRGGKDITPARTDVFKGNGASKAFLLNYPLAKITEIRLNSVVQDIGVRGIDTAKDFYYQIETNEITQDDAAAAITSSDTLEVDYQGFFPIILSSQDDGQIATRIATEGGSGIYESVEDDPNITDSDYAIARANGLLRKYGTVPRVITFDTDSSVIAGLPVITAGRLVPITLTAHNLNGLFLIENVQISDLNGQYLVYTVRCLDGEHLGGWQDFFRTLVNSGRKFAVKDNEVITYLRSTVDNIVCADTLVASSGARESRVGTALVGFSEAG